MSLYFHGNKPLPFSPIKDVPTQTVSTQGPNTYISASCHLQKSFQASFRIVYVSGQLSILDRCLY